MFKFNKIIGIVSDTNVENITNVTGNRRNIKTDNHSNLNFYIDDKNYTLSFMKSKIIDDKDKIKLLYVNLPFGRNEVLTIKNLTKNRNDFNSRFLKIFFTIISLCIPTFFLILIFFLMCSSEDISKFFTILLFLFIVSLLFIMFIMAYSLFFMKKNKKWLLEDDFKEK